MEAMEALALVGGQVEEELLLRNEYLALENQILKSNVISLPVLGRIHHKYTWNKAAYVNLFKFVTISLRLKLAIQPQQLQF